MFPRGHRNKGGSHPFGPVIDLGHQSGRQAAALSEHVVRGPCPDTAKIKVSGNVVDDKNRKKSLTPHQYRSKHAKDHRRSYAKRGPS
jgi:hypothetical protein